MNQNVANPIEKQDLILKQHHHIKDETRHISIIQENRGFKIVSLQSGKVIYEVEKGVIQHFLAHTRYLVYKKEVGDLQDHVLMLEWGSENEIKITPVLQEEMICFQSVEGNILLLSTKKGKRILLYKGKRCNSYKIINDMVYYEADNGKFYVAIDIFDGN